MKLTVGAIEAIADDIIAHAFGETDQRLHIAELELAVLVYNAAIKPKEREFMASCRDGMLATVANVGVSFEGNDSSYKSLTLPEAMRVPYDRKHGSMIVLTHKDPLGTRILKFWSERSDHFSAKKEAKRDAERALRRFGTLAAVKEHWPEVVSFVEAVVVKPVIRLPAVPVDKLNKVLKLPPKDKK